jgi:helicase
MTAGLYLHPLTVVFIRNSFDKLCTNDELDEKSMINIALRALVIEGGEKSPLFKQDTATRALIQWIDEEWEEEILRSDFVAPGDLYELTVEVGRISSAASTIAKHLGLARLSKQFSVVSQRIRFGVKEELIPLMELSVPSLGRRLVRELYSLGYTTETELLRASPQELTEVAGLPGDTVTMIKQHLERLVVHKQRA